MDDGKKQGLVQWINALEIGCGAIENLRELSDGKVLLKLQYAVQNHDEEDAELPQDCFNIIEEYLEVMYSINYRCLIDNNLIIHSQDELEIAKVVLLLLCVSIVSRSHNIDSFVVPVFQLDQAVQEEVKELIEAVISTYEPGRPFHPDFNVLTRKRMQGLTDLSGSTMVESFAANPNIEVFSNSPQPTGRGSTGSLKELMSPLLAGSANNSPIPFSSLSLASPHVKRLMAKEKETKRKAECLVRQKEFEMRRLTLDLHTEKNLREDLEIDIEEKTKIIESREHRIKELENQQTVIRLLREENEGLRQASEERSHLQAEVNRLTKKLEEYMEFKNMHQSLDSENKQLMKELHLLTEEVSGMESLREELKALQASNSQYQTKQTEMEACLKLCQDELAEMTETKSCALQQLAQSQEVYRQQKEAYEELLQSEKNSLMGESLGFVTQQRVGELETELDQLKTDHQKLRESLDAKQQELLDQKEILKQQTLSMKECLEREQQVGENLRLVDEQHEAAIAKLEDTCRLKENELNEHYVQHINNLKQEQERLKHAHSVTVEKLRNENQSEVISLKESAEQKLIEMRERLTSEKEQLIECHKSFISDLEQRHCEQMESVRSEHGASVRSLENDFKTKIDSLSKDNKDLENTIYSRSQELDSLQTKLQSLQKDKTSLEEELSIKAGHLETSKAEITAQQDKILSLNSEFEEFRTSHDSEVAAMTDKLSKEKANYEVRLAEIIASNETAVTQLKACFEDEVSNVKKSFELSEEKLMETHAKTCSKLEEELNLKHRQNTELKSLMESEKGELEQAVLKLQEEKNMTVSELRDIKVQLEALEADRELSGKNEAAVSAKLRQVCQEKENLISTNQELSNEMVKLRKECEREISDLQEQHEEELTLVKETHSKDLQLKAEEYDFRAQQISRQHAEVQISEKSEHKAAIKQLEEQIFSLQLEAEEKFAATIQDKDSELRTLCEDKDREITELTAQLTQKYQDSEEKLRTATESFESEISKLQQSVRAMEKDKHDSLESLKHDFETRITEMESQFSRERQEFQDEMDEIKDDIQAKCERDVEALKITQAYHIEQLTNAHDQTIKDLKEVHDSQIRHLTSQADESERQMKEKHTTEIDQLTQQNQLEMTDTRKRWTEQLQERETKEDNARDQLSQLIGALEGQLSHQAKQHQVQLSQKEKEFENQLKTRSESFQAQLTENKQDFQAALSSKEEEYHTLLSSKEQEFLTQLKSKEQEYDSQLVLKDQELQLKVNNVTEELEKQMTAQRLEFDANLMSMQQELEAKTLDFNTTLDVLKAENLASLVSKQSDFDAKLANMAEEYEDRLAVRKLEFEEELKRKQEEYLCQQGEGQHELTDLRQMLETVQGELAEVRIREAQWDESHNKCVQQMDSEFTAKHNSLREDLQQKYQLMQQELQSQLAEQKVVKNNIESELTKQTEIAANFEAQLLEESEAKNRIETQLTSQLEATKKLEVELKQCIEVKNALEGELSEHVNEKQRIETELSKQLAAKEEIIAQLSELKDNVLDKQQNFEVQLSERENMVKTLTEQLNAQQVKHKETQEWLERRVSETEAQVQQKENHYQGQLANLKMEMDAVYNNNTELQDIHDSVTEELREKNQELLTARKLLEEKEKSLTELQNKLIQKKKEYKQQMEQATVALNDKIQSFVAKYENKSTKSEESMSRLNQEIERLHAREIEAETQLTLYESKLKAALTDKAETETELAKEREILAKERDVNNQRMVHLMSEVEKFTAEQVSLKFDIHQLTAKSEQKTVRCAELEQANQQLLGRQLEQAESRQREMKQAADFNAMLQAKLDTTNKEAQAKLEEQLRLSEDRSTKLQQMVDKLKSHCDSRESRLQSAVHELEAERTNVLDLRKKFEQLNAKFISLQKLLHEEEANNKKLNSRVRSLEVNLEHSERQNKEYKCELEKAGTALLGDYRPSFVAQTKPSSSSDDSTLDDSLEAHHDKRHSSPHPNRPKPAAPYFLRSRRSSAGDLSQGSRDSTPNLSLQVDRLGPFQAITVTSSAITPKGKSTSSVKQSESGHPISIKSKLKEPCLSTRSLAILNSSLISTTSSASTDSTRSANVPRGAGSLFSCEDEEDAGMQYEWNRLGELQHRNTLCLAHLKTCYPVETQAGDPSDENTIRGRRSETTSSLHSMATRKRRSEAMTNADSHFNQSDSRKTACRSSSERSKLALGNHRQRHQSAEKVTPRRSNRRRSKSAGTPGGITKDNIENIPAIPMDPRRESIAFSIDNTPKALRRGLKRQMGFVRKSEEKNSPICKLRCSICKLSCSMCKLISMFESSTADSTGDTSTPIKCSKTLSLPPLPNNPGHRTSSAYVTLKNPKPVSQTNQTISPMKKAKSTMSLPQTDSLGSVMEKNSVASIRLNFENLAAKEKSMPKSKSEGSLNKKAKITINES